MTVLKKAVRKKRQVPKSSPAHEVAVDIICLAEDDAYCTELYALAHFIGANSSRLDTYRTNVQIFHKERGVDAGLWVNGLRVTEISISRPGSNGDYRQVWTYKNCPGATEALEECVKWMRTPPKVVDWTEKIDSVLDPYGRNRVRLLKWLGLPCEAEVRYQTERDAKLLKKAVAEHKRE